MKLLIYTHVHTYDLCMYKVLYIYYAFSITEILYYNISVCIYVYNTGWLDMIWASAALIISVADAQIISNQPIINATSTLYYFIYNTI